MLLAVIQPNNWAGAGVAVISCLGASAWIALLFGWDVQGQTQADRDHDILKGPLG